MTTNRSQLQNQQEQQHLSAADAAAQNVLRTSNSTLNAFLGYPRKSWMQDPSNAVPNPAGNTTRPPPAALAPSQRGGSARGVNRQNGSGESSQQQSVASTRTAHSPVSHSPTHVTASESQPPRLSSFSNSPLVANSQVSQPPSSIQSTQASTLPSPAPSTEQLPSPRYSGDFEGEAPRNSTVPAPPRGNHNPNPWRSGGDPIAPPATQPPEATANRMRENPAHRHKRPRLDTTNQSRPVVTSPNGLANGSPANGQMNQRPSHPGDSANSSLPSLKYFVDGLTSYAQSLEGHPPGDVSQPRFHLLKEACQNEDCFYLALHQVFCLRTASPAAYSRLSGFGPKQEEGLQIIEQMLVSNSQMPKHVVLWCAGFPTSLLDLLEHSPTYRTSIAMVISFLELVSRHWDSFDAEMQRRGYPPLIDELVAIFATTSSVLHSVMFKALLRRLCGWDENRTRLYESVYNMNRDIYARRMRFSRSGRQVHPAQTQLENEHLVAAYQNLQSQFQQGIQNPFIPNVAGSVGQNQQHGIHRNPGRPTPTVNTQFPCNNGDRYFYSPSSAQSFSHPSTISHPNHPSLLTPSMSPTRTAPQTMQHNGPRVVPQQARFINHYQQQRVLPSQIVNNLNNTPQPQVPPKPRQPLLRPAHARPSQLANPNPSIHALHQAPLKSPMRKFTSLPQTGAGEENTEYFQYIQSFALGPHHLGRTDPWYEWEFTVSADNMQKLPTDSEATATRPAVRTLKNGTVMYRLRCSKADDSSEKVNECAWAISETAWPSIIYIHVNETELFVRRKLQHGKDLPLDISKYVKEGLNKVSFGFLRNSAEKERVFYALAIEVVEVGSLGKVRDAIETLSRTQSLEQIKARLNPPSDGDDDEIAIVDDYITIDLIDPFTAKIFEVPVRSKECPHRECFDLRTFLKTRSSKPPVPKNGRRTGHDEDWKCPICGRDARPQLLFIDEFLSSVQSELRTSEERLATTRAIRVRADGSWEAKAEKETNGTGNSSGGVTNNGTPAAASESTAINQDKQGAPPPSTTPALSYEVIEID